MYVFGFGPLNPWLILLSVVVSLLTVIFYHLVRGGIARYRFRKKHAAEIANEEARLYSKLDVELTTTIYGGPKEQRSYSVVRRPSAGILAGNPYLWVVVCESDYGIFTWFTKSWFSAIDTIYENEGSEWRHPRDKYHGEYPDGGKSQPL